MRLLSYMDGFRDELEKIALGWKTKATVGLGAAALGYGGYRVAKAGKRMFIDEPRAREEAAIQNYTPSPVIRQQQSPYGPYVW